MIIKEFYRTRSDGINLYRHYSDKKYMLLQVETGIKYDEAIDIEDAPFSYEETDILIESYGIEEDLSLEEQNIQTQ
jgi:hypothetical protein